MSHPQKQKSPAGELPPPRSSLWRRGIHVENVVLIAAVAFVVGVLVGRTGQVRSHLAGASGDPHAGLGLSSPDDPHADLNQSSSAGAAPTSLTDPAVVQETLEKARTHVADMKDPEALVRLGNNAFDQADSTRDPRLNFLAIAAYERALELRPGDPNVQTDLGIAYRNIGQSDEALKHFRAAQASDPNHSQSQLNLAVVYLYDQGNPEKAAEAAERCLSLNPPQEVAATAQQILAEARQKLKPERSP